MHKHSKHAPASLTSPYAQNALKGGLYMVAASAAFVTNDTFTKLAGSHLPVGEIVAVRGGLATLLIAGLCWRRGVLTGAAHLFHRHVFARALLDLIGTLVFIMALLRMPLADLTAIMQVVPVVVVGLAALFLKERVGWRRASAVAVGLIGVLFIIKPGFETFTIYQALVLAIVVLMALRDIITRQIPQRVPSLIVALANALFVTLGGLGLGLAEGFVPLKLVEFAGLAAAALFLSLGYLCMVLTLRLADLSATAHYRYAIVPFSIVSSIAVFGDIPDGFAVFGMGLIVASGLYTLHREARLKWRARMPAL